METTTEPNLPHNVERIWEKTTKWKRVSILSSYLPQKKEENYKQIISFSLCVNKCGGFCSVAFNTDKNRNQRYDTAAKVLIKDHEAAIMRNSSQTVLPLQSLDQNLGISSLEERPNA